MPKDKNWLQSLKNAESAARQKNIEVLKTLLAAHDAGDPKAVEELERLRKKLATKPE